jgi:pyruvate/2-oxoglutarate dehydrogenase complex dihydrolipoamide dehydrogenase (E3) component
VAVTDRGFINVDIQMRTNVPHIFAIGDVVGQPMLAHKAVHEAHVAAKFQFLREISLWLQEQTAQATQGHHCHTRQGR